MILLDFSQVCIANFAMAVGKFRNTEPDIDLIRHMVLNTLRRVNFSYRNDFGALVIACDGSRSWRHEVFPYYKANRAKTRSESDINWPMLFKAIDQLRGELLESFSYRVLKYDQAEADDIIATLASQADEPVLIVSGDKDFKQLQRFKNVKQYDPIQDVPIFSADPERFLLEHLCKGDSGDGIPNILSDDDTFVVATKRQKTMRANILEDIIQSGFKSYTSKGALNEVDPAKYARNKMLIDLTQIPKPVQTAIMDQFNEQIDKFSVDLYGYFVEHGLDQLIKSINDFTVGEIQPSLERFEG